jgi:hypothetical protein
MTLPSRGRVPHAPAQNLANVEAEFERELEVFRSRGHRAILLCVLGDPRGSRGEEARLAFRRRPSSCSGASSIRSRHTTSISCCGWRRGNPQMFSKSALARRKQGPAAVPPAWLNDYVNRAYVPKAADFRHLRRYVNIDKYRPLRHQVFAHEGSRMPPRCRRSLPGPTFARCVLNLPGVAPVSWSPISKEA